MAPWSPVQAHSPTANRPGSVVRPSRSAGDAARSGSGRRGRPGPARARGRGPRRGRPRRRSGNALGSRSAQVEQHVVGAVGLHPVEDRRGDLVARGELVGEPLARRRRAASRPRRGRASVISAPSCSVPGSASAVGWNWQNSRSASVGAGGVGEHRAGADRAPGVGRPLPTAPRRRPVARTVARAAIAPRVGDHAGAALAVAPQRDAPRSPSSTSIRGSCGDQLGEPRGDRAPGLAAAGVDDPARGVAALEAERELAARRRRSKLHPARSQLRDRRRAPPRSSTSTALARQSPRPAASVSSAWRSGESSGASAAASPPCAQKLELSASGLRETSATLGAAPRRPRARRAARRRRRRRPRRRGLAAGLRARRAGHGRGYRIREPMALYVSHPSSLRARHRRPPRERRAGCGRSRRRSSGAAGRASSASRRPAATPRAARARPHRRRTSTRSRSSAPRAAG